MSRSDRDQRDAQKAARRAKRLAERAESRAQRKTEQARRAHERAERLAEQAGHRRSDSKRSIEDFVDDMVENYVDPAAERWSRKAESWFEGEAGSGDQSRAGRDARRARRKAEEARRAKRAKEATARRRSRRSTSSHRRRPSLRSRFNTGRGLYRDKARGKICGVCAGLADYLDVATWQVRLVAVLGLVFVPSVAVPVYFIFYFLMDNKPYYRRVTDEYDMEDPEEAGEDVMPDDDTDRYRSSSSQTRGMTNVDALHTAREKFADLEGRLRSMETHVTSSRFELQRELRKISGEDA